MCTLGSATALVFRTGADSIQAKFFEGEKPRDKFYELNYDKIVVSEYFRLSTSCTIFAIVLGLLVGLIRGAKFIDILVMTWVFVIAIIPEGFLLVIVYTYRTNC